MAPVTYGDGLQTRDFSYVEDIAEAIPRIYETKMNQHLKKMDEHIEKMGLTTELIGTKEGNALYIYLTGKGLDLPSDSKAILDEYVGKDYSFVVSLANGSLL
jgi:hypothetical protein